MPCSFKVLINKDKRKNLSGIYSINIRVTLNRVSKYLKLPCRVEDKHWSGKESKWIKESSPLAFELNSLIQTKLTELKLFEIRQQLLGKPVTLEKIVDYFFKKTDPYIVNDYFQEFIEKAKTNRNPSTIRHYNLNRNYLNSFRPRVNFSELNESFVQSFVDYLQGEKKLAGVTTQKVIKILRMVCREAVKEGYLEADPLFNIKLKIKKTVSKRVYLEIDEILKLKNYKIPPDRKDLEDVRISWLMCFYAGFYYKDLQILSWSNILKTEYGYIINGNRSKNGNSYIVPIHKFKQAVEIIEMQRGLTSELVFPNLISEGKYNEKLKELAKLAGISKKLMNKTARHSFIQFWESQGLATQHTGKMVGHNKEATTKSYYELSARDINEKVKSFDFSELGF